MNTPDSPSITRRKAICAIGTTAALSLLPRIQAAKTKPDSLSMQLYKSLSEEQHRKICLPVNDPRRNFVSNWWYVHPKHRLHNTFNDDQRDLAQQIFDSLHAPDYRKTVSAQVKKDMFGKIGNTPSIGFFGSPEDKNFEFIYTGHHVTRRCNAHTDTGQGFGGAPIFYGHFAKKFHEDANHTGNPYWYQGKIFNEFVESLSGKQQEQALAGARPRSEKDDLVIRKRTSDWPGLHCADLSKDQQAKLLKTMRRMMAMFRPDDVNATMQTLEKKGRVDRLHVSYYAGRYDIGNDKVWDTWQIEGPDMVWYCRGVPHIHTYFHVKV